MILSAKRLFDSVFLKGSFFFFSLGALTFFDIVTSLTTIIYCKIELPRSSICIFFFFFFFFFFFEQHLDLDAEGCRQVVKEQEVGAVLTALPF